MRPQVVIMAQGQQRRLASLGHPKHLLPVNGEPIITRTLRLLLQHRGPLDEPGPPPVVIGPRELDDAIAPFNVVRVTLDRPGSCIVTGIRAALEEEFVRQEGRVAVLLGDVVWSRAALARVMADRRELAFAGTPVLTTSEGEVFAALFDDPQAVKRLCETCPCVARGPRWRQMQGGHLRRLLWHAMHVNGDKAMMQVRTAGRTSWWAPAMYLPIDDWTTDIDKPADVARLPALGELAAREGVGRN